MTMDPASCFKQMFTFTITFTNPKLHKPYHLLCKYNAKHMNNYINNFILVIKTYKHETSKLILYSIAALYTYRKYGLYFPMQFLCIYCMHLSVSIAVDFKISLSNFLLPFTIKILPNRASSVCRWLVTQTPLGLILPPWGQERNYI